MTHNVKLIALQDLKENPLNPKAHDEDLMARSLTSFGYVEPIVIDERTGLMISGHGRSKVLRNLFDAGEPAPAGVEVKDGKWLVPVVTGWSSKDDTEANAVLVALNRTTEKGGWVEENLLTILQELADTETLDVTGYVKSDIALLERAVEAQGVFTVDVSQIIDEFLDDTGADAEKVGFTFSSVVRVYFQTEDARDEFFTKLGYKPSADQKRLRYPLTWEHGTVQTWNE